MDLESSLKPVDENKEKAKSGAFGPRKMLEITLFSLFVVVVIPGIGR